MSHLNTLEVYSCLDTLFSTLYGADLYRQWKELKDKLQFDTEHLFVQWMLNYVNENYINKTQRNHCYNITNKLPQDQPPIAVQSILPDSKQDFDDTIIIDLKEENYFSTGNDGDSNDDDDDDDDDDDGIIEASFFSTQKLSDSDGGLSSENVLNGINYLDIDLPKQEYCDPQVIGEFSLDSEAPDSSLMPPSRLNMRSRGVSGERTSGVQTRTVSALSRPFKCDICDKRYSCRGNLIQHQKEVHINPIRHPCNFCDKTFSRSRHLDRHIKTLHLGIKQFLCYVCHHAFSRKDQLLKHTKKCTGTVIPMVEQSNSNISLPTFINHSDETNESIMLDKQRNCSDNFQQRDEVSNVLVA